MAEEQAELEAPQRLAGGIEAVRRHLRVMPLTPGVYRMIDRRGQVLYVGKARSLRRRVSAYVRPDNQPYRIRRMISETASMEVVTTHTEVEALLLEINLIKELRPRYNVLLRDDKSFPHILIARDHDWPRILKHRGARSRPGEYFGPFASAGAVNRTLTALQRAFLLRSCSDAVFRSRTRPCLLHQIKRCSAPCVGRVTGEDYEAAIGEARAFLSGQSQAVQQAFSERMQAASDALEFETAALYRDRIRALTRVQAHQDINVEGVGDADVIAAHFEGGQACIQVFFFRAGQNFGNRAYFPTGSRHYDPARFLAAFVGQFYSNKPPPRRILLSARPAEDALLAEALSLKAGRRIDLRWPMRGAKRKLVNHALANAREALARRSAENATQRSLLQRVAELFDLEGPPERIEVYDNSHIQGRNAVGGMVVAGPEGLVRNAYRKFNIKGDAAPGDDFAMMREVLRRRFSRALKEDPERAGGSWPDLVLIDGGAGQLSSAQSVLAELGIEDLPLAAIAKGPDRNAGRERFFADGKPSFSLPQHDPALHFLQRLRDEAHRFAIGAHRARRAKTVRRSPLDDVAGIGAARKRALLHHFGSARGVEGAGFEDLLAVPGISKTVAKRLYDHFHPEG